MAHARGDGRRADSRDTAWRPRRPAAPEADVLERQLLAASFSASVRVAPCVASRSISAALNSTRLPMRMGLSFPVRWSQKSVVSPIFKTERTSSRVKRRGPVGSILSSLSKVVPPSSKIRRVLAHYEKGRRAPETCRGTLFRFFARMFPCRASSAPFGNARRQLSAEVERNVG